LVNNLQNGSKKRLIIYDLDGTLVDSAVTVTEIINLLRKRKSMSPLEPSFVKPLTALGGERLLKETMNCSDAKVAKYLKEFRNIYAHREIHPDTIFTGVIETLASLKALGLQLAMCTNKPRDLALKTIDKLSIKPFFDYSICGGDLEKLKPYADPLLKITRVLEVDVSECIFVGDTSIDYYTAKACGMDFLLYDSGYDLSLQELHNPERIYQHIEVLQHINGYKNVV
jgi:phosphoglycolate phosphatase